MKPKRKKHLMIIPKTDIPEFLSTRIDSIRNRLDDNNYTVDIQQLTSKLIDLEIALSGPGKKQVA
jgi:hypothetical protein